MVLGWVPQVPPPQLASVVPAPFTTYDPQWLGPMPDPALMIVQRLLNPALFAHASLLGPPPDPSLTVLPSRCAAAVELLHCISNLTSAAASAVRKTALARSDPALADPGTISDLESVWTVLSAAVAAVPACLLPADMAGRACLPLAG